jgi:two-component system, response regulator
MATQTPTILLVEDSSQDLELALHALKKNRLANQIHTARDGEEALDYIFARGAYAGKPLPFPKLVLLDLKLPKVDGLEVLKAIKSDPRTMAMPVVVMTTSREEQDLVRSYALGVNSYIIKPVDFAQFSESVRELGLYWLVMNQLPHPE